MKIGLVWSDTKCRTTIYHHFLSVRPPKGFINNIFIYRHFLSVRPPNGGGRSTFKVDMMIFLRSNLSQTPTSMNRCGYIHRRDILIIYPFLHLSRLQLKFFKSATPLCPHIIAKGGRHGAIQMYPSGAAKIWRISSLSPS
jgi:hypothetical protein